MKAATHSYPVKLQINYPDRPLNKLTTFFRIFTLIPIAIILGMLFGQGQGSMAGLVIVPTALLILFCQKYPKWWYEWNENLVDFFLRVVAYAALLTDKYPSTDQKQSVHLHLPYPDVPKQLNRWLPLVKWFLAIPHYVILVLLSVAAILVVIISWFAILFTGRLPQNLFNFVVGVMRWYTRVLAYAALMLTDEYPPFSLED